MIAALGRLHSILEESLTVHAFGSRIAARFRSLTGAQWALVCVLVLAAGLRLLSLGAESLWVDEITTLTQTTWSPLEIVRQSVVRGTPPIYYLLQLAVFNALPHSEFSLRLLSALADLASVYLVYAVGRRFVGEWSAVLAAALMAASVRVLWFAQEARAYSLGMMLTLLLVLTLLRLADRPSWGRMAVHAAVAVALLYTHVYSTFALIGIEAAVLVCPSLLRRMGRYWWTAAGIAVVSYVPWVVAMVSQIGTRSGMAEDGSWTIKAPAGIMSSALRAVSDLSPGRFESIPAAGPEGWIVWAFFAVVLFGFLGARAFPELEERAGAWSLTGWERRAIMLGWAGMLILGGIFVSKWVLPIYSWRMATQAAPVIYLAAANGVRQTWRPAAIALVALFVLYTVSGLKPYYADSGRGMTPEKEGWRPTTVFVGEHGPDYDAIVVSPAWLSSKMQTYAGLLGYDAFPQMTGVKREQSKEQFDEEMPGVVAGMDRVLVITSHMDVDKATDLTALEQALVDDGWEPAGEDDQKAIRIRAYELP